MCYTAHQFILIIVAVCFVIEGYRHHGLLIPLILLFVKLDQRRNEKGGIIFMSIFELVFQI